MKLRDSFKFGLLAVLLGLSVGAHAAYTYRIPVSNLSISPATTKSAFTYTGAPQVVTPPAGAKTMTVYLWGAGGGSANTGHGGGGSASFTYGGPGGGGGFVQFTLAVSAGASYTVDVGQGGFAPSVVGAPLGSTSYTGYGNSGTGGGSTQFLLTSSPPSALRAAA